MKVIGVYGGSGAGKSTATKKLSEVLPNCLYINVDIFMRQITVKRESNIFKRFGIEKDQNISRSNYIFASKESMDMWLDEIKDEIVDRIEKEIQENGKDKDYIIVDWCFLPICSYFKKCDYTLCIKTQYDIRYDRLANRMKDISNFTYTGGSTLNDYKKDAFENRVKYTALDDYNYKAQYVINNNSDVGALNKEIVNYATKIVEDNNVNKFF